MPLDTPFGREGSEGSKGSAGSKGGGIALRAMSFIAAPRLPPTGGIYNSLSEPARPAGGTGDAQGPQARRRLEPGRRKAPEPSCFREYSFFPHRPFERSEHNPFIQPAAKRRPLFAFGNTVCLMSSRQLVFTAIYLKHPAYRDSSPGVRMTRPARSRQRIADSGWPTADRGQQNSPISLHF